MKTFRFILIILIFLIEQTSAQTGLDSISRKSYSSKIEVSVDYTEHTRFNNPINTANLNCFFWKKKFNKNYFQASVGLTITHAWGYSEQYKVSDTIAEIDIYKTSGYGIGPIMQIEHTILKINRFSLSGEANGGVMIYTTKFPYGGDYYNFMFRMGPNICYRVCKNGYLKIGYRWMHVSNGKGYGNQNPFYEAQGAGVGFIRMF